MACCRNGHEACARVLVDAGAAVDAAKSNGFTALMRCCQDGHEACARVLVDAGAAVDAANSNGMPPFVSAPVCCDCVIGTQCMS